MILGHTIPNNVIHLDGKLSARQLRRLLALDLEPFQGWIWIIAVYARTRPERWVTSGNKQPSFDVEPVPLQLVIFKADEWFYQRCTDELLASYRGWLAGLTWGCKSDGANSLLLQQRIGVNTE